MSYYLVPITNLIISQTLSLGNVIIVPPYKLDELDNLQTAYPDIFSIIDSNKEFFDCTAENLINIAILYTSIDSPSESNCEDAIYKIDRSLDYLRINFCRLDIRETLIGIPGLALNRRYLHFYNSTTFTLTEIPLTQYLYSLQPGIGLDLDILYDFQGDPTYHIFNSCRIDEVYIEYRTILARACYSFHITDLNRCFCYLFSSVERMGNHSYSKFQNRKKKIISYISSNQHEYDILNHQFFFYSKKIRTEIIHKGINLIDILPLDKINELLQNLFLLIIRFCTKVISSEITNFVDLEVELQKYINCYTYAVPTMEDTTLPDLSIFDSKKHIFFAEVLNLDLEITIKQGNVIFVPKNSINNYSKYYWNYVYLDLIEQNNLNPSDYPVLNLGSKRLSLNEEFASFTAYDLDIILNTIKLLDVQELNNQTALAIILDEPFLEDTTWSFSSYSTFADIICHKINHAFDYIILSTLDISQRHLLPSLAGINSSKIRGAYMLDDLENFSHSIPGKVFSQYIDYSCFKVEKSFNIEDNSLFNTLFNNRFDEVAILCKTALRRIVDCYYTSDFTIQISYMFDILDMLDPEDTEGNNLKTHVLPFLAFDKTDYHKRCSEFKSIRTKYRNPLVHHGKNIYELIDSTTDIYNTFSYLKNIIVSYCTTVYELDISTFSELDNERDQRIILLNI